MMGLEPTTFCMASRRSSQLSYIRASHNYRRAGSMVHPSFAGECPGRATRAKRIYRHGT
jgi:hypothetical protein